MTLIVINENAVKLEIYNWDDLTEELFKGYAEWRLQLNKDKAKYVKDKPEQIVNQENVNQEKVEKTIQKVPNNTTLFRTWIETRANKTFKKEDFTKDYSYISEEQATKIIDYQLQQGNLNQLSKDKFKLRK